MQLPDVPMMFMYGRLRAGVPRPPPGWAAAFLAVCPPLTQPPGNQRPRSPIPGLRPP